MNQKTIVQLIVETVDGYRVAMSGEHEELTAETCLFGPSGLLDSLGLVSVLVELEQKVSDASGRPVSLMDDKAMSETSSPFRTIRSLADYLGRQLESGPSA
jgi:acyl carrier protein